MCKWVNVIFVCECETKQNKNCKKMSNEKQKKKTLLIIIKIILIFFKKKTGEK